MKRSSLRFVLLAMLALLTAGVAAMCSGDSDSFYSASKAELSAGAAGTVIRAQEIPAFDGAKAWRVLYRSTGLKGEPIAVSGIVVAPEAASAASEHPVVAWAHPTTGIATKCAPSLGSDVVKTIPGVDAMVRQGFVVAATDYVGLGTAGPHPYLIGVSAARSMLDSVRAARAVTPAGPQFAVWGHSQGGHAVLWAGKLASDYAPDIKLVGVAAAAPPTDLATLLEDDLTTPAGQAFTALTLLSWSRVFGIDLGTIVHREALRYVDWIGNECMTNPFDLFIDELAMHGLKREFLKGNPAKAQPWQKLILENTPNDLPPHIPLLITQGRNDGLILPAIYPGLRGPVLPSGGCCVGDRDGFGPSGDREGQRRGCGRMDGGSVCGSAGAEHLRCRGEVVRGLFLRPRAKALLNLAVLPRERLPAGLVVAGETAV